MINLTSTKPTTSKTCLVIEYETENLQTAHVLGPLAETYDFRYCSDYEHALAILAQDAIDLIILSLLPDQDVQDGVDFFNFISAFYPVILWMDQPEAIPDFSVQHGSSAACLTKPIRPKQLQLAIQKVSFLRNANTAPPITPFIFIKIGRLLRRFTISEILYVQAYAAYSKVMTFSGTFTVNETITSLENRLPRNKFIRIQKSYLVSIDHITGLERKYVLLEQEKLPIGATYRKHLLSKLCIFDI